LNISRSFKQLSVTGVFIAAAFVSLAAQATAIDFTALPGTTAVTTQYAGVTFSLAGGNDASGAPTTTYAYQGSSYGGLTNTNSGGYYPTAEYLVATFSAPVIGVSFSFYDAGYNGANAYYLYDTAHVLIGSGNLSASDSTSAFYDLTSYTGVSSIVWDNGVPAGNGGNWWQSLQSLSYTAEVPEPTSIALLGLGLAGLAASRRKVKQA
jgi:hypothetical protein